MNNNLGFDVKDWEETEAREIGEFENLDLGGHEVVIKDARIYESEFNGNQSLKVCVDIAGNDKQKDFFKKQYEANTAPDKKWPTGATRYLSLKKESLGFTKGFVTALEKSNNGFKFDLKKGWEQINGLKCAGVFGLEEYQDNEGKLKTATKLTNFRSLDKLKEIQIPRVKLLNGNYMPYDDYQEYKQETRNVVNDTPGIEITDEMLPF